MTISTGIVKHGVIHADATLYTSTGAKTLATYTVATGTTVCIRSDMLYQRSANSDNGVTRINAIVRRGTAGENASVITSAIDSGMTVSWGQGTAAVSASGTTAKVTVHVTAQPVRVAHTVHLMEVAQDVFLA